MPGKDQHNLLIANSPQQKVAIRRILNKSFRFLASSRRAVSSCYLNSFRHSKPTLRLLRIQALLTVEEQNRSHQLTDKWSYC